MKKERRTRYREEKDQWKEALYSGKGPKLRRIHFLPATRAESGAIKFKPIQNEEQDEGIDLEWKCFFRPGAGLHNLGNTCFMNSVLQCLTYTPPLAQLCLDKQYTSTSNEKFDAMQLFQQHTNAVLRSPGSVVAPHKFSRVLRFISNSFRLGRQEDSHEFFRCLIDRMIDSYTKKRSQRKPTQKDIESTVLYRIFGGKLQSQVHCTSCQYKSSTYDPILDLNLEIYRAKSLEKALNTFTCKEVLDGNNKYKCPRCRHMVRATKQMLISKAPNILAIQLKRFTFGKYGMKIENMVTFPSELDMTRYVSETGTCTYSLYGVLVHSGHSLHSGHYYCFVKCPSGAWICCDDSSIHQVSEKMVLQQKAYMLFYVKDKGSSPNTSHVRKSIPMNRAETANKQDAKRKHQLVVEEELKNIKIPPLPEAEGSPRSPSSPQRSKKMMSNGSPHMSPLVSISPSLQKSKWKRFLLFLPRMRLQVAGGMKKVVQELKRVKSNPKIYREAMVNGNDPDMFLRRSKRIQQMNTSAADERADHNAEEQVPPMSTSSSDSDSKPEQSKSAETANHSPKPEVTPQAPPPNVKAWLKGDMGRGPYGLTVNKWNDANESEADQASKLFRSMKPTTKRRDMYDQEYDEGKVKKVKARKKLKMNVNVFQRAMKRKGNMSHGKRFNRRSNRR